MNKLRCFFAVILAAAVCLSLNIVCIADTEIHTYFGVLEDNQDALSDQEEAELLSLLDETAGKISANVGVVLADSYMDGKSEYAYTKDFLDSSFGEYSDSIVLMLVKSGSNKVDQIFATDRAYDKYGKKTERIFDAVYSGQPESGDLDYPMAIRSFCGYLSSHSSADLNTNTGDISQGGAEFNISTGNFIGAVIGLIIAFVVTGSVAAGYRKKTPISARAYMDTNRTHFTERRDTFVREYTTSHRVSSSSSGGSHHSGGSHRSGGGGHRSGGGGGRRR